MRFEVSQMRQHSPGWRIVLLIIASLGFAWGEAPAQEQIDPRAGQLRLSVVDLSVPAGPITLDFERSLENAPGHQGVLGSRWRSNWESRAVQTAAGVTIEETAGPIAFSRLPGQTEYRALSGEKLVVEGDGRFVRTTPGGAIETFDRQGRLMERDYRNGNRATVRYGADGRIARIDGPRGSFIQVQADKQGRVAQLVASMGRGVRYGYAGGELAEVQPDGGPAMRYGYDARGALARIENPLRGTTELTYDGYGRVISRKWADGTGERYEYDDAAHRMRHVDAAGGVVVTQWSADGRTATVTDALGHSSSIEYDAAGRPVKLTGPAGASARTAYDALGRIASVEDPLGQATRFEYADDGLRVKRIVAPDGSRTEADYDGQGNLTGIRQGGRSVAAFSYSQDGSLASAQVPGSPSMNFTYQPTGLTSSIADSAGNAARFDYDARGNLVRQTDAQGGMTQLRYNAQGQLVGRTEPAGATTRLEYAPDGRMAALTDPAGTVTRYRYAPDRPPARASAAAPPTSENTYDMRGRLVRRALANGDTESYDYDASGRLAGFTHSSGARWGFRYDAGGRLVEVSGPQGYRQTLQHDAAGRLTESGDVLGRKSAFSYDALGRLTSTRDAAGTVWRREYDGRGRLAATIDPLGRRLRFLYDAQDRLLGVESEGQSILKLSYQDDKLSGISGPGGSSVQFNYDAAGLHGSQRYANGEHFTFKHNARAQLVEAADGLGHAWQSAYTPFGQLAAVTEPDGARHAYSYTPLGQLDKLSDAKGHARTFRYDAQGRQTAETDPLGRTTEMSFGAGTAIRAVKLANGATTRIEHDLLGRPVRVTYADGRTASFRYDAAGNLIEEQLGDYRASYRYDALDRLVEASYQPANKTVRYEYDAVGRRTAMEVAGTGRWSYEYDGKDRLLQLKDPQGRTTRFDYDDAGRITQQTFANGIVLRRAYDGRGRTLALSAQLPGKEMLLDRRYRYDVAGNLAQETREGGAKLDYAYDANGRLVGMDGGGLQERFAYDAVGNRLLPNDQASYDAADQVSRFGAETFTHDQVGRLASRSGGPQKLQYVYDAAGRLGAVKGDGGVVAEYGYDTHGRRISKKAGGATKYYVFDGIDPLMEVDASGQVLLLWTPGPEIGRPVQAVQQGKALFPIGDLVGSVVALTDERGGLTGRWDYAPFGELRQGAAGKGGEALAPIAFAGKEFDRESGLYHFGAREYDPFLGRFFTPDPIGGELSNPPSLHAYQYAFNNPLRYRDVTGMAPMDIANSIDRSAARVGESIGPSIGRTTLGVISAPVRAINWFRGEEGRKSNERLNTFIDKQAAPVGKGAVAIAASVASEPLRLGQATGAAVGSRNDLGQRLSAWDQAKVVGTEVLRGASVIAPIDAAVNVAKAGVRSGAGALADYGRRHGGIILEETGELLVPARQAVGEGMITSMGEGGASIGGRVFVNNAWAPQFHGQLFAHEGVHTLITNTLNAIESRLGTTALTGWRNTSTTLNAIEEAIAWTAQNVHARSFGGPTGQVFGRSFAPPVLEGKEIITRVPNGAGEILENIATSYLGWSKDAAKTAAGIAVGTGTAGGTAVALAPYPASTLIPGWSDTKEPRPPGAVKPPVATAAAKPPDGAGPPAAKPDDPTAGLPPELVDLSEFPVDPNLRLPHLLPPKSGYDPRKDRGAGGKVTGNAGKAAAAGSDFGAGVPGREKGDGKPGGPGGTVVSQGGYQDPASGAAPGTAANPPAGPSALPPIWCWSDETQAYSAAPMYPCPPTQTRPRGSPPTGGGVTGGNTGNRPWRPPLGAPLPPGGPAQQGGGGVTGACQPPCHVALDGSGRCHCPGQTAGVAPSPGTANVPGAGGGPRPGVPATGTASGGGGTPGVSPPGRAAPTTPAAPGTQAAASGQDCDPPLCTSSGQTPGKDCIPVENQNFIRECYLNMLRRCQQGMSGRSGGWCVKVGADPSCEARAARVCGGK